MRILSLILLLGCCWQLTAQNWGYEIPEYNIKINKEQQRISAKYYDADFELMKVIDKLQTTISSGPYSDRNKVRYLRGVYTFLSSINHPNCNVYFKSGKYRHVIDFVPKYIEVCEQGNVIQYLKSNHIRAMEILGLYIEDNFAEEIIYDVLEENPGFILRNAELIAGVIGGDAIILDATLRAPLSAKALYDPKHIVHDILKYSSNEEIFGLIKIYEKVGISSKAYIMLHDIQNDSLNIVEADAIGRNSAEYFQKLCELALRNQQFGPYSLHEELEYEAVKYIWELNRLKALTDGKKHFVSVEFLDAQQLFMLACYAYKEIHPKTIDKLFKHIRVKQENRFSRTFYDQIDDRYFKGLYDKCQKHQLTNNLLSISEGTF